MGTYISFLRLKPKQIVNKSLKKKTFQGKRKYLCCFESGEKQMHEKRQKVCRNPVQLCLTLPPRCCKVGGNKLIPIGRKPKTVNSTLKGLIQRQINISKYERTNAERENMHLNVPGMWIRSDMFSFHCVALFDCVELGCVKTCSSCRLIMSKLIISDCFEKCEFARSNKSKAPPIYVATQSRFRL